MVILPLRWAITTPTCSGRFTTRSYRDYSVEEKSQFGKETRPRIPQRVKDLAHDWRDIQAKPALPLYIVGELRSFFALLGNVNLILDFLQCFSSKPPNFWVWIVQHWG